MPGASVRLTNDSTVSLIEGDTILLCITIDKTQALLLDRMVPISVTSSLASMEDRGEWL